MNASKIACVVLASGLSERFGEADKLSADLQGRTILSYVLQTAAELDFGDIFCVAKAKGGEGVTWVKNDTPELGQGHALRLGLRAARAAGWNSCVLMLGDMPLIRSLHLEKILKKRHKNQSVASICESVRMPPVFFNRTAMDLILDVVLTGGAKVLFDQINPKTVQLDMEEALDVDTPEDLARVARIMQSRKK